jgi:sugar (pentulose or hexulose) kinase
MRAQLYAVFATLASGMNILYRQDVRMERFNGHGGLFTTPRVAQQVLADALESPVAILKGAEEGGAWGIAALAAYRYHKIAGGVDSLADFLERSFFSVSNPEVCLPNSSGVDGFRKFMSRMGTKC